MDYWEQRAEQLVTKQIKADDKAAKKLAKEYARIAASIEKDIASYYQKYSKDDVIDYRKMVDRLSEVERDLLYKDYDSFAVKYPQYKHLMPVRESIYKLNRLEGLQLNVRLQMLEIGAIEEEVFQKHLKEAYERGYLNTMKGLHNASSQFLISEIAVQQALAVKWIEGGNFSSRVWNNKEKLIRILNNEIRDAMIRGDSYAEMTRMVQRRTGVGAYEARRLVHTESQFMSVQGNAKAFMAENIERYENCAVMDSKTSKICKSMDGQIFEFKDMQVGVNCPPYHSFCRTTIIPIENGELVSRV